MLCRICATMKPGERSTSEEGQGGLDAAMGSAKKKTSATEGRRGSARTDGCARAVRRPHRLWKAPARVMTVWFPRTTTSISARERDHVRPRGGRTNCFAHAIGLRLGVGEGDAERENRAHGRGR